MKILVTGSHFTPAQATIEELNKVSGMEVVYIGRTRTIEGDPAPSQESIILPLLGVKFIGIEAGRLRRNFDIYTLISLIKIPVGFLQAFYYLIKERPQVVLSFGGYVGLPVVFFAWLLSIPVIIHEQTLVTGLANYLSAIFANKIAVSFGKGYKFNKDKIIITGNPLRQELLSETQESSGIKKFIDGMGTKLPLIYITGGNQGSHVINMAIAEIARELTERAFIIHQTGDSKFQDFEKLIEQKRHHKNQARYFIAKWINVSDISLIYKHAKLVISRAGANTLCELAYFGVPAIVVPVPYLSHDEQTANSKFFGALGLCEIILQKELAGQNLLKKINHILKNYQQFKIRAQNSKSVIIADAAKRLSQEVLVMATKS